MSESDPLSHQSPDHRFLLASCRVYPEPCPAAKGLRIDSKGQGTLSTPWRPSSDVAKCWASATSPGMPEEQDKGGHQQYWIHTTLLTGSLHKTEPGFTAWPCSHPPTLRLPHGHSRQQPLLWIVLQGLQGNLHLPPAT